MLICKNVCSRLQSDGTSKYPETPTETMICEFSIEVSYVAPIGF